MFKKFLPTTLAALSFASTIVFVRYAYQAGITTGMAIFLRFLLAGLVMGTFLRLSGRWQALPMRQSLTLVGLGLVAYTTMGVTWFIALKITPAWLVSLFAAIYPLMVTLFSWLFLKEIIPWRQLAALAAVVGGGMLIFWRPFEGAEVLGLLLMLVNLLVNTVYVLVGQRLTRNIPPMMTAFWMICGAAVGTFGYALAAGEFTFQIAPQGWVWTGLLAIFSTSLAISFLWWGIGLLGPSRAAIVGSLEPVFSILLAVLVLGETLSLGQAAGAGLILAGVFIVQLS